MGRAKQTAALVLAVGVLAASLKESVTEADNHHQHGPGTYFGSTLVATSTSAVTVSSGAAPALDWSLFRIHYADAIEILRDSASERTPRAAATFVLV